MLTKKVLAKGQVVIPKTLRDMLGIHVGDEVIFDVKDNGLILRKKGKVSDIFREIARNGPGRITQDEVKDLMVNRLEEKYRHVH